MRELSADLCVSLDGFASGVDEPASFGYFGPDLGNWIRQNLDEPQVTWTPHSAIRFDVVG